jgi:hypothetical protein
MQNVTSMEKIKLENLSYQFTKSANLLSSYYKMRADAFASVWNLKHSKPDEDPLDLISDILVVLNGDVCVAGARLTIHKPLSSTKLSFEVGDFDVCNVFPERNLNAKCYGEISRFAISEEYRGGGITSRILDIMAIRAKEYGCECFIVVSPMRSAQFFKKIYATLGYTSKIHEDIIVPDRPTYEGIQMRVMVIELGNSKSAND